MKKVGQLLPIRVYSRKFDFVIIFGHRRYLAGKKAGFTELNCIIVPEPTSIDRIYTQIIENEQLKEMSPEDREAYIKLLLEKGESYKQIAENIGKSESWVRENYAASSTRAKFQNMINNTVVLDRINKRTKKKMNSGKKSKKQNDEGISSGYFPIIFGLKCDKTEKTIIIKKADISDLTEPEADILLALLYKIYESRGYRPLQES